MLSGLLCAVGILLVRAGLATFQSGCVRAKNAAGMIVRHLVDLCAGILILWAIGAALMPQWGGNGVITLRPGLLAAGEFPLLPAVGILVLGGAIVAGAVSERARFWPAMVAGTLTMGLLLPIAAYWAWSSHGWLLRLGFMDRGGAAVVHLAAGCVALIGARAVGPRDGKYNRDGSSNGIPGHNQPLAGVGALLILIGWLPMMSGFCPDEQLSRMAGRILLAASGGGLAGALLGQFRYGKPDVHLVISSVLGALVAVTASAGAVDARWAVLIGVVAGILVPILTLAIDLIWRIDDPTGGIAVHLGGGAWGTLAAGLFAPAASFSNWLRALGAQALGLVCIALLAALFGIALFSLLKAIVTLRSREADEYDGLDLAEHDIGAYPDFQQTMIKSYHLREA